MNTPDTEKCEECEQYGKIRVGSVHKIKAMNCRIKPSDPVFFDPNTPDNRPEAVLDRILEKKGLVPQNTPDTEWQEDFFEYFKGNIDGESKLHCNTKYVREFIQQLLSSRDTYWKERVEEAVKAERERILKACDVNSFLRDEDHEDFVVYLTDIETITKATPITNEDNLK